MTTRDYAKKQIDMLPENALEMVLEYIAFQRYNLGLHDNDTEYILSVPGMADRIKAGLNTPLTDCVPLSEVWPDV